MNVCVPRTIIIFEDKNGTQPFIQWLHSLDRSLQGRIDHRLLRLSLGNFGDYKNIGSHLYELRCHFGAGYRVYFGVDADIVIVLLAGGDKSSQKTDIRKAEKFWHDYREDENGSEISKI